MFELAIVPEGKARARVTRFGTYTPAKTRAYERAVAWQAKVAMQGKTLLQGGLTVTVTAVLPIPPSWSKRRQEEARRGLLRPTGKPDWDNLGKAVSDALNGIVWKDDAQIVDARIVKVYGDRPLIRVEASEIKPSGGADEHS